MTGSMLIPNRANLIGLGMIVLSGVIAGVGGLLLRLPNPVVMIAVGVSLIVMDLIFRVRSRGVAGWLTQSRFGGYFFFIPVWILGLVVIAINVINTLVR